MEWQKPELGHGRNGCRDTIRVRVGLGHSRQGNHEHKIKFTLICFAAWENYVAVVLFAWLITRSVWAIVCCVRRKTDVIDATFFFLNKIMSDSSLKLKRVESPDRKVLLYFDEVSIQPTTVSILRRFIRCLASSNNWVPANCYWANAEKSFRGWGEGILLLFSYNSRPMFEDCPRKPLLLSWLTVSQGIR